LSEHQAYVFYRVVLVHIQITLCREVQVETTMAREKLEHVVKEADPRRNMITAVAIQVPSGANIRFAGLSVERCRARLHVNHPVVDWATLFSQACASRRVSISSETSSRPAFSLRIWADVPIVNRRQPLR